MAKAKTGPEDEPKEEEEEEPSDGDEGTSDDGGGGAGDDSLTGHIRAVVKEVVDGLLGERPAPPATGSGPRQDEAAILAMVKEAQGKLRAEEERDARFKEVAGKVESLEKVVEKAPARAGIAGKVQAFLWGSE